MHCLFFSLFRHYRKKWSEKIPAPTFLAGSILEQVFRRQLGLTNEKWSRTHCLAAQILLATTNTWLEKYRGNYIQPLSKSVTWHMWPGNKTANGGWLLRQSRLSHYVLPLRSHACHSNTRDELLNHIQGGSYVPVCSRLTFEYMFVRQGQKGPTLGKKGHAG